jgi:hypothetical protein
VKTLPHAGQRGQAVSFSGTRAAFNVVAQTEIIVGATTGALQVTTPTGTILSAGPFTVLP